MKKSLSEIRDLLMPNISFLRKRLNKDLDLVIEEGKLVMIQRSVVLDDSKFSTEEHQIKAVTDFIERLKKGSADE